MISFWRIFSLELKGFVRSKTALMLLAASVGWMYLMPYVVKGDGTAEGAREMNIHYSLGGVFALLVIALVASATGTLAKEREAKRLQLTLIRPIRYPLVVLAKVSAHVLLGAAVLMVSALVLVARTDASVPCSHVLKPILPTPREEAKEMYAGYMADKDTPDEVKKAPKAAVLRLLENRAIDHYQTIPTNETVTWRFAMAGDAVRLRITNRFDMRQEFLGRFISGAASAVVSNMTQSVLVFPFKGASAELSFENLGAGGLMLRPRKDVEVLVTADSFAWNLVRTCAELLAVLTLLVAFAAFLSATLSRPVAMFVAMVTLLLGEMSPSVVEQYPDELGAKLSDRIGLALTRFAAEVTRPVSSLTPLTSLSKDECVEPREVARVAFTDIVVLPFVLALISGLALRKKKE